METGTALVISIGISFFLTLISIPFFAHLRDIGRADWFNDSETVLMFPVSFIIGVGVLFFAILVTEGIIKLIFN